MQNLGNDVISSQVFDVLVIKTLLTPDGMAGLFEHLESFSQFSCVKNFFKIDISFISFH